MPRPCNSHDSTIVLKTRRFCDGRHIEHKPNPLRSLVLGLSRTKKCNRWIFGADKLRRSEFENACRGFWLAYVMMETGEPIGNKKPTLEHANEHPVHVLFGT